MRRLAALLAGAALCVGLAPASAAQPRWRDPFARPAVTTPAAAAAEMAAQEEPREPQLRAIIYDRAQSLVNIDGRILALGDSAGGYKLVQVDERSVTLAKAGKRITLTLTKDSPR